MSKRSATILKAIVTLSLLSFLIYRMDLGEFWDVLSSARWGLVLIAALIHFLTVFFSVARWKTILRHFDIRTAYPRLMSITLIGYFFNMFLPSAIGGDFFRAYYLAKQEERGMSTTLTTTFIDRTSGLTALLLIGLVASVAHPIQVQGYPLLPLFLLLALAFSCAIVAVFHSGMHRTTSRLLFRFQLNDLAAKMELVYEGLGRFRSHTASIISVTMLSLGVQLLVVLAIWVAAMSISIQAPFHTFLIFIPIVNLSMAIPLTINGVGLRESVYFLLFSQIGVAVEASVTLSLLNLVIVAGTSVPGGLVYALYKREEGFKIDVEIEEAPNV